MGTNDGAGLLEIEGKETDVEELGDEESEGAEFCVVDEVVAGIIVGNGPKGENVEVDAGELDRTKEDENKLPSRGFGGVVKKLFVIEDGLIGGGLQVGVNAEVLGVTKRDEKDGVVVDEVITEEAIVENGANGPEFCMVDEVVEVGIIVGDGLKGENMKVEVDAGELDGTKGDGNKLPSKGFCEVIKKLFLGAEGPNGVVTEAGVVEIGANGEVVKVGLDVVSDV